MKGFFLYIPPFGSFLNLNMGPSMTNLWRRETFVFVLAPFLQFYICVCVRVIFAHLLTANFPVFSFAKLVTSLDGVKVAVGWKPVLSDHIWWTWKPTLTSLGLKLSWVKLLSPLSCSNFFNNTYFSYSS